MPVRYEPPPAGAQPRVREEAPYVATLPAPDAEPLFSALVPVLDEETGLAGVVQGLVGAFTEVGEPFEILIVDGGTRDGAGRFAGEIAAADRRVRVLHQDRPRGLGAALRTGIRAARGAYVVGSPVYAPLDAEQIRAFLEVMEPSASFAYLPGRRACDIAVGFRRGRRGYGLWRRVGSWGYRWMLRVALRMWLRDFTWICMYRRSVFETIDFESDDFMALPEILARARRAGLVLQQIDCPMRAEAPDRAPVPRRATPFAAFTGTVRLWLRLNFGTQKPASPIREPRT